MTVRIGLLGASRIAPKAVIDPARARTDVRIVAVGARDVGRARRYAEAHAIADATDYAGLAAHPEVDLVYVALPPSEHLAWTRAALAAGKAVLVEKPFAMTGAEARAMVAAAEAAGRPLLEAFHYRFHAAFRDVEAIVGSGALGPIRRAEATFHAPIAEAPGELRWVRALGGGALMDLGCYALHALRTLLRAEPEVVDAACEMRHGVDAATRATLRFGPVEARIVCSMLPGERHDALVLEGEAATLRFQRFVSPQAGGALTLTPVGGREERRPIEGPSSYAAQLDHAVEVVAGRAPELTGGADAVAQARAIDAIYAVGRPD